MLSAILVLGLGLCVFSWFSSLLHQAYRQDLPGVGGPHELLSLELRSANAHYPVSLPLFEELERSIPALQGLAASTSGGGNVVLAPGLPARRLSIGEITPGFFGVLGTRLFLGTVAEGSGSGAPVCVVSHRLWEELRNLGVDAVGHTIQVNGAAFWITGVAPAGFHGTFWGSDEDLWVPVEQGIPPHHASQRVASRDPTYGIFFTLIGRSNSASDALVSRELNQLWSRFEPTEWGYDGSQGLRWLVDSDYSASPEVRSELDFVFGSLAVALLLVLLICLLNASSLLVSQASEQQPTWAVMQTLGAGPRHLMFTVAVEVLVWSVISALWATALAASLGTVLPRVQLVEYAPELQLFSGTWSVFSTTLAVSLALGLVCAVAPARLAARNTPASSLRAGAGRKAIPSGSGRVLVLIQLASSFALICLSLLFWRSLENLHDVDLGLELQELKTARLEPGALGFETEDYQRLFSQLNGLPQAVPSIKSLAFATTYPFHGSLRPTRLVPEDSSENTEPVAGWRNWVTAGYFEVLGVPLAAGRDFHDFETYGALEPPRIAILSRTVAKDLWPGENPLGKLVRDLSFGASFEIVGVVEDHKTSSTTRPAPMVYFPLAPSRTAYSFSLVTRTGLPPGDLQARLEEVVRGIDPKLAVYEVQSLEQRLSKRFSRQRMLSWAVPLLSAFAVVLAALGMWGLVAGNVRRRRRELGVRLALGATPARLQRKAVGFACVVLVLAAMIGLALLAGLESWIAPNLYQVGIWNGPVLLASALILALFVGCSCVLAVRRIGSIDPAESLRVL